MLKINSSKCFTKNNFQMKIIPTIMVLGNTIIRFPKLIPYAPILLMNTVNHPVLVCIMHL